ncbi:hypothetical protein M758_9G035000 [Ceratodon purpureus]|nr:hypothetical protein M758_9G035000 [Ceratodon purpureus]
MVTKDAEVEGDCETVPVLGEYTVIDEAQLAPGSSEELVLTFNSGPRPYRDTKCGVFFIVIVLLTYALGFVAVKNADFDLESKWRISRYNPGSGECELIQHGTPHVDASALVGWRVESFVGEIFTNLGSSWAVYIAPFVGALVLVMPLGFFSLWIFHRYTCQAVVTSLRFHCFFLVLLFLAYASLIGYGELRWDFWIPICVIFLASAIQLKRAWSRVPVVVQIMKSALHVVTQNLSLFLVHPVLSWMVILIDAPIITFIVYASNLGRIAPDFDAIESSPEDCSGTTGAPCCRIDRPDWAIGYLILASLVALWVIVVSRYLHSFVVSGAIAEWYAIAPHGSSTAGLTRRSLRNALGPSFGTICCSASLMTGPVLIILNWVAPKEHFESELYRPAKPFYPWGIRQSPLVVAAVSGEGFLQSARVSYDLSRRRRQPTLTVQEYRLLYQAINGLAFAFSLLYFFTVWGAMYYLTTAGRFHSLMAAEIPALILWCGQNFFHRVIFEEINTASYCTSNDSEQHHLHMDGHQEQEGDQHEPLLGAMEKGNHATSLHEDGGRKA